MGDRTTRELRGQWMKSLTGSGAGVLYNLDSAGRTAYVSSNVQSVLGWDPAALRSRPIFDIVPEEDQELLRAALLRTLHGDEEVEVEFRARHLNGEELFVEATMVRAGDESQSSVLLRFRDVTQRKTTERELRGMVSWFRALTRNSGDVIVVLGSDGNHRFVSGSSEAVLGYPPDEFTHDAMMDAIRPRDRMGLVVVLEGLREEVGSSARHTVRVRHQDGTWRHLEVLAVNRLDDRTIAGVILYLRDVTEQRLRDDLTDLPNRILFVDRLQEAIDERSSAVHAVALLELDRFALVKSSLGTEVADNMLVQFARRIRRAAKEGWTIARVGEGQFAALLTGLESGADAQAQVQELGGTVEEPFHLAAQEVYSGLTVGLALSTRKYSRADAMLRDAEGALQKARVQGSGEVVVNTELIQTRGGRLLLESDLIGAIERNEFRVHYQPIYDAVSRAIRGFEALVRWEHPRDGLILPGRFIGVAEETGLIVQIGEFVLRQACEQLALWSEQIAGADELTMAVNLSTLQLRDEEIVNRVAAVLLETGIEAQRLKLEITETALIDRPGQAGRTMSLLKDLGVGLALDDFGTGYSSLSYLSAYPFDVLKIDRAFVSGPRGLDEWHRGRKLIGGIIQLGHALGLDVVAEGVEDESQAQILAELDCDILQGYHLARPGSPEVIERLLQPKRRVMGS